jgi:hypothetical protein
LPKSSTDASSPLLTFGDVLDCNRKSSDHKI